ncbi:hypothetical protein, conserved [Babesia bigemina]|uniref:FPL domain-containing protein n=1 Tax=Babesia bigemina TaxID=5866 RepID=A0A061D1M0_BABBI|nr:hypothetical protein, conserved [Babesia bigemina]CDR94022.1 hypothetical protein, conserved [Babesia bigemina]|eukprot:XP_012766208.1 hypothetical protein, conserved [Babesia bigemina]
MAESGGETPDAQDVAMTYLEQLRMLHSSVLNRQMVRTAAAGDVVDALKQLAELVIWGEKNDFEPLFDYFCEENMMDFLTAVLPNSHFRLVRIQLLQTISMIIHNVVNERMLCKCPNYLLSNNYLNALITHPNMHTGGDVSSWTASLLKTLSGILNQTTIKFFCQEGNETFPLLDEAVKLLSSSDSMKRAHAMTIMLNILRLNDPSVTRYLLDKSHILTQMALYLRYSWRRLNKHVKNATFQSVGQTESILLTQCDDVFQFLMDVMDVGNADVNEALLRRLFSTCFFPLLCSLLRGRDTEASLLDAVDVPELPQCGFFRSAYQQLLTQNGLLGVYATNKSDLFAGTVLRLEADGEAGGTSPTCEGDTASQGGESASTSSTPRSMADFQNMNIPAMLLANEMLPNVAYYLLVTHLASARRDDVRRYILLLTMCPFIPRKVLEHVAFFNVCNSNGEKSAEASADDKAALDAQTADAKVAAVFSCMNAWERHVYGPHSIQLQDGHGQKERSTSGDYVPNLVMGEFVRIGICCVSRNDSRLSMLMALMHSLQNSFMKQAPSPDIAGDFPFEQFIAVPSTAQGLHVVVQGINSVAKHLSSPSLRVQTLSVVLSVALNSIDIIQQYNPSEIASMVDEIRFHLDTGFNELALLIDSELEHCTSLHISVFYDEWLRLEAGVTRRLNILEYPHILLDPERNGSVRRRLRRSDRSLTRSSSLPTIASSAKDGAEPQSKEHVAAAGAARSIYPEVLNEVMTHRTPISLWLFGDWQDRKTTADRASNQRNQQDLVAESRLVKAQKYDTWEVMREPLQLFRRHLQVACLVKDTLEELGSCVPSQDGTTLSPRSRRTAAYDRCPLLKEEQIAINGTPVTLGALVSLEKVRKYPCVMVLDSERKRRFVVCNDTFFLLVREKPHTSLFEATCIHPLWNVEIRRLDVSSRTCSVVIMWYPESKESPREGQSYCEPMRSYSVTAFDIVFNCEEDIVEYARRFNIAVSQLTAACASAIRNYLVPSHQAANGSTASIH